MGQLALIPGIGRPAAVALGALAAAPEPVAVESVSGRVHMPRRPSAGLQARA